MASIYSLKPGFQKLLQPVVKRLARMGVSANQITIAALVLSLFAGSLIAWSQSARVLLVLPPVLLVRMALNAMDGMLAREYHQESASGAILNEIGDVISDVALYLPLAVVPGFRLWPMIAIVILSMLTEMTGVMGVGIGASRRYDGPLGKSDRAFLFGLMGLLFGLRVHIERGIPVVLFVTIIMLAITIANRMRRMLLETSRSGLAR
jgi:CDP-diacylglycerol--glycerol-3-phosphate 3-phosphatidyltransferase